MWPILVHKELIELDEPVSEVRFQHAWVEPCVPCLVVYPMYRSSASFLRMSSPSVRIHQSGGIPGVPWQCCAPSGMGLWSFSHRHMLHSQSPQDYLEHHLGQLSAFCGSSLGERPSQGGESFVHKVK